MPAHVAIIMDGNGRWAKNKGLPRTRGHLEGVKRVEEVIKEAARLGIRVLTLYTFSTENWDRPRTEISLLMNTLTSALKKKLDTLKKNNIRFQTIGRRDPIPKRVLKSIEQVTEETRDNTGLIVNLAFNYGSRAEIIDAVKNIAGQAKEGILDIDEINEEIISGALYTRGLPDPDLLIRTSGEQRISNFLLWQCSYTEFYFTQELWPNFTKDKLKEAVEEYQKRERRYGAVGVIPSG